MSAKGRWWRSTYLESFRVKHSSGCGTVSDLLHSLIIYLFLAFLLAFDEAGLPVDIWQFTGPKWSLDYGITQVNWRKGHAWISFYSWNVSLRYVYELELELSKATSTYGGIFAQRSMDLRASDTHGGLEGVGGCWLKWSFLWFEFICLAYLFRNIFFRARVSLALKCSRYLN